MDVEKIRISVVVEVDIEVLVYLFDVFFFVVNGKMSVSGSNNDGVLGFVYFRGFFVFVSFSLVVIDVGFVFDEVFRLVGSMEFFSSGIENVVV